MMRVVLLLCLALTSLLAIAREPRVEAFNADTWKALEMNGRPAVVVFTTTDCAYCPQAIKDLTRDLRLHRNEIGLHVVVVDGEGQEAALAKDTHFRKVDRLFVFHGDEQMLRYRVNPEWRGMVPYIALLPADGNPRFFVGKANSEEVLSAFQMHSALKKK